MPKHDDSIVKTLRELNENNATAKSLFEYFSRRKNALRRLSIAGIYGAVAKKIDRKIEKAEVVKVMKSLAELGLGKYVKAEGKPSRFYWFANSVSVGNVARGKLNRIEFLQSEDVIEDIEQQQAETVTRVYLLRPNFQVTIKLPADTTKEEAGLLADAVRTFYFPSREQGLQLEES